MNVVVVNFENDGEMQQASHKISDDKLFHKNKKLIVKNLRDLYVGMGVTIISIQGVETVVVDLTVPE